MWNCRTVSPHCGSCVSMASASLSASCVGALGLLRQMYRHCNPPQTIADVRTEKRLSHVFRHGPSVCVWLLAHFELCIICLLCVALLRHPWPLLQYCQHYRTNRRFMLAASWTETRWSMCHVNPGLRHTYWAAALPSLEISSSASLAQSNWHCRTTSVHPELRRSAAPTQLWWDKADFSQQVIVWLRWGSSTDVCSMSDDRCFAFHRGGGGADSTVPIWGEHRLIWSNLLPRPESSCSAWPWRNTDVTLWRYFKGRYSAGRRLMSRWARRLSGQSTDTSAKGRNRICPRQEAPGIYPE